MKLDKSQKAFCESSADRLRLLAPAGSGKTLSLLWRCKTIQEASGRKPQRFLVVTFTKSARDALRERIKTDPDLQFLASHVQINTLNAFGFRYLRGQQTGLQLVRRKDAHWLLNNLLRPVWSQNAVMNERLSVPNTLKNTETDILDAFDILKGLGFRHDAKNLLAAFRKHREWVTKVGLDRYFSNSYGKKVEKLKLFTQKECDAFVQFWADASDHLTRSNVLTFGDQKYWAMLKLEETKVAPNQRFHHILVDEFQDVDPLDMNFIKLLVKRHESTLTIVGDDDQAIFEWRGAVPRFILEPENFLGGKFDTCILGCNYRSPSNIVKHAKRLIEHNAVRVPKDVTPKNKSTAQIAYREFDDYQDSCAFVMDIVREIHEGADGRKVAIIGRKKSQIIPYQILLAAEHIPFYAKEDLIIFLQKSFKSLCDTLVAVSRRSQERRRSTELIDDFMLFLNKVKKHALSKKDQEALRTYLNNRRPKTLQDVFSAFYNYSGSIKGGVSIETFYSPLTDLINTGTVADTLRVLGEDFKGFAKDYGKAQSLEDIFYIDPPFFHLADYAQKYGDDYDGFLDDLEEAIAYLQEQAPADTEEERDADEDRPIHLMTALRAKGKEYHTVVVLDAIDGIWPSKLAQTAAEREQERRLFYVAVTRPQERLFILANSTILGEPTMPSPYIAEMGITAARAGT